MPFRIHRRQKRPNNHQDGASPSVPIAHPVMFEPEMKPIACWQRVSRLNSGSSQERLHGLRFAVNVITDREVYPVFSGKGSLILDIMRWRNR